MSMHMREFSSNLYLQNLLQPGNIVASCFLYHNYAYEYTKRKLVKSDITLPQQKQQCEPRVEYRGVDYGYDYG